VWVLDVEVIVGGFNVLGGDFPCKFGFLALLGPFKEGLNSSALRGLVLE